MTERITTHLIPWPSRRRRFAANVQALAQRDPIGAELVQTAATNLDHFELHSGTDGNYFIRDKRTTGPAAWLGGMMNHKATENIWQFDRAKTPTPPHILFDGLGYGWLFLKVLATTERSFLNYSCALYVLEGDPTALAMLFYMHDLQNTISHPRTRWFVRSSGSEALQAFREAMQTRRDWTIPEQLVRCPLRSLPLSHEQLPIEQAIQYLLAERARQRGVWISQAAAYYADKDATYWSRRFHDAAESGAKLRVLGITSRYTTVLRYSMEEMKSAVDAAGCDMRIAIEPDDHSSENPFMEQIEDFKPDLILIISRMRYENPWLPRNVPFVCWDQDNLPCMRTPQATASLDALTFVAGHGAVYGALQLQWPLRNCIFCHPTGMTHRYRTMRASAEDLATFAGDISYLSHASGTPETLRDNMAEQWLHDKGAIHVFRTACDEVIAGARDGTKYDPATFLDVIHRVATATGKQLSDPLQNQILVNLTLLTDRVFRHETLKWAARWCESRGKRLRLWGNGWEQHESLSKYAAGAAMPGGQAQQVFMATKLNLQIIETGILHSRLLDGWAAGGFFLIRQNNREDEEQANATMWQIGQLSLKESIETIAQLEQHGSDDLKQAWKNIAKEFCNFDKNATFPGFHIWRGKPPANVLIPNVEQVLFTNETQFCQLADRYINSENARQEMLQQIGGSLQKHFSYDARWQDFLSHIRDNLK
ncbi:MAG: hypothetical protein FWD61_07310 [Phycisphaerales bacterium]|nr:hypothetical protein [Phycisphaerales bacterium]